MTKQTVNERKEMKILINQVKALIKTMERVIQDDNYDMNKYSSCNDFMFTYQGLIDESLKYIKFSSLYQTYDIKNLKNSVEMIPAQQKKRFVSVLTSARLLLATLEGYFDFVDDEIDNLENLIYKRFRSLFRNVPNNEKEVQNMLENLFIANNYDKGIDYDRETGKFMFSGREYIPDFIIPKFSLCIEVKILKESSKKSKIIEEINADITAYTKLYDSLIFIVYDIGVIRDETEFKRDIEASGNIKVLIIKH